MAQLIMKKLYTDTVTLDGLNISDICWINHSYFEESMFESEAITRRCL